MKTSTRSWINSLLIALLYGVNWGARNHSHFIDSFYSNKIYPSLYHARVFFFELFPFSLGDLFYLLGAIVIVKNLLGWKRIQRKNMGNIILVPLLLFLWFQLSWGLNYYKTPLNLKEVKMMDYSEEDLINTTALFARESNRLHFILSQNDSLAVVLNGTKKSLLKRIEESPSTTPIKGKIKSSLYSKVLSYMGFSGYLNPFTLEAHVNIAIPKINLPLTAAHEMAHQQGYAAENEANYIGFLRCYQHPDQDIQYAALLFGLRYTLNELYRVNPEKARAIHCSLYPGILENIAETNRFWLAHKNPLEPFLKRSYDSYLKANNQPQGIQSYNAVVGLLITHFKVIDNSTSFKN